MRVVMAVRAVDMTMGDFFRQGCPHGQNTASPRPSPGRARRATSVPSTTSVRMPVAAAAEAAAAAADAAAFFILCTVFDTKK